MDKILLQAEPRPATGRHELRTLRAAGKVPAVVYGPDLAETKTVAIDSKELHRALVAAGASLITLQVGDESALQVLAREVQRHPIKRKALHVDFMAVSMTERLRLQVPVVIEGTAPAASRPELVMVRHMDEVEIECLPGDIPQHLVANLSNLKTEHDTVCVSDLILPAGVKALGEPHQVVISFSVSRAAVEEEETEEAETTGAEPEVMTRGKKEEEE